MKCRDTEIQVPNFRSADMRDRKHDAKASNTKSPKGSFFWSRRRSGRNRSRFQFRMQHLEDRFLLAGDFSPTIDPVPDLLVSEDADLQSISLSGISAGAGLPSSLRISASSQNELLVGQPTVIYQAGQPSGILKLQPTPDANGAATIIVTVEDSGPDNDETTVANNGFTTVSFTVNVASVNDPPTLTQPESVAFKKNSEASIVASSRTVTGRDYGELHTGSIFTSSIDLTPDGTGMIVGASGGADTQVGYVEVYQRADELSQWTQIGQQLVGDDETALGRAVSLNDSSTRIAISTGRAVSIMELDTELATWVSLGTPIMQPGIVASLAMDSTGNLLAIATADSDGIPNAQLHRFDGTAWNLEQGNLTMGQDVAEDVKNQVAQSQVAMNAAGTRLIHSIAGCGCSGTGYAKVYERNTETSTWSSLGDRIQGEGSYGSATSISGDGQTITLGAPQLGTETDLFGNGLVEVLRYDTDLRQWLPHGNTIVGTANTQQLGTTVALSHDAKTLLIGSPGASTESASKGGKVGIFQFDDLTSDWQLIQEHDGPDANGSFGWRAAVSATGNSFITGARGSISSPNKNGALLSFSRAHSISLAGITAGGNESQAVRITALSEQSSVTGQPTINYASDATKADLLFRPDLDQAGMAVIKVTVEDTGLDGDFDTAADNGLTERTFSFGVGLSNFEKKADLLTLALGEAGVDIRLGKNTDGIILDIEGDRWIGEATEKILLPEESRMVLPNLQDFDRVELLLEEERKLIFDDTTAWRLGTPLVDGQRFLRSLTSQDDPSEIIYIEGGAVWQNPIDPNDIDASGHVSPIDVLQIINELTANLFSDPLTGILFDPLAIGNWPNRNFDQNASGHISALDVLRVINHLAAQQNAQGGEGEFTFQLLPQSFHPFSHLSFGALYPEVSHSLVHFTPSDSQTALDMQVSSAASLFANVNNPIDTLLARKSATEASGSQPASTTAFLSISSNTTNAVDDVFQTWQ
ncbi:dockerin type I domain-containing protein [bacterium]|nr:dockerin type I domain-containing protein [bacterium]